MLGHRKGWLQKLGELEAVHHNNCGGLSRTCHLGGLFGTGLQQTRLLAKPCLASNPKVSW